MKDTFIRSCEHWSETSRNEMENFYALASIDYKYLAEKFNWTEDEIKDFKKLLLKITGRDILPAFTNEFVQRIAYMMKQKKYYDLEDKEMYDAEAIDVKYSKHFDGRYTPLKYWKQHKDSKVCVDFAYQPGDPNRFVTVGKKLMINVFEKNEITNMGWTPLLSPIVGGFTRN